MECTRTVLLDLLENMLRDKYPRPEEPEEGWKEEPIDLVGRWMERIGQRKPSDAKLTVLIRAVALSGSFESELVSALVELACAE